MTSTRVPVSTRCDQQVWDRARAAVAGMLRHDPRYSLADLVEAALVAEIDRLEAEYNEGAAFGPAGPLPRGRRLD